MPALGLDVGTYTFKAVAGQPGSKVRVDRTAEAFNPLGIALPTDEATTEKLIQQLDAFFTDHKLPRNDVRVALPESAVSTKIISIPPLNDAELASAIGWQAEQHIPIPFEELSLEYQVLFRPPRGDKTQHMRILLVGARKVLIERYVNLFLEIGIEPTVLETETLALIRAMQFTVEDPTTLVVNFGASTMNMSVVQAGELSFVYSHLNGGMLLSRAIEQQLGLDVKQAEQYKRTYGLDPSQFEGKLAQVLEPSMKIFVSEMQKAMQFFVHQQPQDSVKRILLSGGSAQLKDVVQYITQLLGVEVLIAAPFAEATGQIPEVNHSAFSACMGLMMRES